MKFYVCEEMQKLRTWLKSKGIKYLDASCVSNDFGICRTHFCINGNFFSVINGMGTYGGMDPAHEYNADLLEIMSSQINGGEPIGFLNAKQTIKEIEKAVEL